MKILFICSSLQNGKDGVGDYTRLLAKQLSISGNNCLCFSLNDSIDNFLITCFNDFKNTSNRLFPLQPKVNGRINSLCQLISDFQPDWVSLQYVPYGYDSKGLPFFLPYRLSSICGEFRWHIMFHELWYGEVRGSSFKDSIVYFLQRLIIRQLLEKLKPLQVHTHIGLFMERLRGLGTAPVLLPLFGNIPVLESPPEPWGDICPALMNGAKHTLKCGVFGSVAPGSLPASSLLLISEAARQRGAKPLFIHFGEPGGRRGREAWEEAMRNLPAGAEAVVLGHQSSERISAILHHLDLGLSTTPPSALGKSGTFAAMREHGLPVIASAPDFFPVSNSAPGSFPATNRGLADALSMPRIKDTNALEKVARQFAWDLDLAAVGAPR